MTVFVPFAKALIGFDTISSGAAHEFVLGKVQRPRHTVLDRVQKRRLNRQRRRREIRGFGK